MWRVVQKVHCTLWRGTYQLRGGFRFSTCPRPPRRWPGEAALQQLELFFVFRAMPPVRVYPPRAGIELRPSMVCDDQSPEDPVICGNQAWGGSRGCGGAPLQRQRASALETLRELEGAVGRWGTAATPSGIGGTPFTASVRGTRCAASASGPGGTGPSTEWLPSGRGGTRPSIRCANSGAPFESRQRRECGGLPPLCEAGWSRTRPFNLRPRWARMGLTTLRIPSLRRASSLVFPGRGGSQPSHWMLSPRVEAVALGPRAGGGSLRAGNGAPAGCSVCGSTSSGGRIGVRNLGGKV